MVTTVSLYAFASLREVSDSKSKSSFVARQSRDPCLTQRRKGAKILLVRRPATRASDATACSMETGAPFAPLRLCVRSLTRSPTNCSDLVRHVMSTSSREGAKIPLAGQASRTTDCSMETGSPLVSLREISDSTSELLLVARQSRDPWLTQRRKGAKVLRVSMPISRGARRLDV